MNYTLKSTKKTIDQLLKAGKYDWVNPGIEPNFKLEKCATEVELLNIDMIMTTQEILDKFKDYRPATMTELLHFGYQYPDIQREYPVVELGSVWVDPDGDRSVGCLWGSASGRNLLLDWCGLDWDDDYRFLFVRKSDLGNSDTKTSDFGTLESRVAALEAKFERIHEALHE